MMNYLVRMNRQERRRAERDAKRGNGNIKIEDNFLDQKEFDKLQQILMGNSTFAWYYLDKIVSDGDERFQFIHLFYASSQWQNEGIILQEIAKKIEPAILVKINAKLITQTPNIVQNKFHVDLADFLSIDLLKKATTSIFYINTNNGYTIFKDGTRVESVANRMVSFPANMEHAGTSCTDENIRVLLNFNYFERSNEV